METERMIEDTIPPQVSQQSLIRAYRNVMAGSAIFIPGTVWCFGYFVFLQRSKRTIVHYFYEFLIQQL